LYSPESFHGSFRFASMLNTLTGLHTAQPWQLIQQIASSGEGTVWRTAQPGILAKLYHIPTTERQTKLRLMIAHPPTDPMQQAGHVTFAWPQELLQNSQGEIIGFLMPEVAGAVKLSVIYNPRLRNQVAPRFNWFYLHTTALNYALALQSLHEAGYIVGDVKAQNILVTRQALVSIIDTDSFQIQDPDGHIHRCVVGSEGFTPPELLGVDLSTVNQTACQDHFRIGIVMYLLLFGEHPFKGKWIGVGEAPLPTDLIRQGFWPYAPGSLIAAGPTTIPLSILHPALQDCFGRCFTAGHRHPDQRPKASEWVAALQQAIAALQLCDRNDNHRYSSTYGQCYWCQRQQTLKVDIFQSTTRRKPSSSRSRQVHSASPQPPTYPTGQGMMQSYVPPAPPTPIAQILAASPKFLAIFNFISFLVNALFLQPTSPVAVIGYPLVCFWLLSAVGFCPGIGEITLGITIFVGIREILSGSLPMTLTSGLLYFSIVSGLWAGLFYRRSL
jgi:DNA-binding helix-hairpin-helix protein with protein kinase domain